MITITGCGNDLIDSVLAYQTSKDETIFSRVSAHCHKNFEKMIAKVAEIKGENPSRTPFVCSTYTIRFPKLISPANGSLRLIHI